MTVRGRFSFIKRSICSATSEILSESVIVGSVSDAIAAVPLLIISTQGFFLIVLILQPFPFI